MAELKFKRKDNVIFVGIKPYKGRRKWVSLKTTDMAVARERARESKLFKMQAVESVNALTHEVFSRIKGTAIPTNRAAIAEYIKHLETQGRAPSTINGAKAYLNSWLRSLPREPRFVHDLKPETFTPFFNPKDGTKYSTLKFRKAVCVGFCAFCVSAGYLMTNAAAGCGIETAGLGQAELTTQSHPAITKQEFDALIAASKGDPFWELAIMIAWDTGLRLSDICLLEKVSVENGMLGLFTRKTGSFVRLPLSNEVVAMINKLEGALTDRETAFMFPAQRAEYQLYGASSFSTRFGKLCQRANVKGKTFHGFRTAFIGRTYVERSDTILKQLAGQMAKEQTAALAGHANTTTTDIYLESWKKTSSSPATS